MKSKQTDIFGADKYHGITQKQTDLEHAVDARESGESLEQRELGRPNRIFDQKGNAMDIEESQAIAQKDVAGSVGNLDPDWSNGDTRRIKHNAETSAAVGNVGELEIGDVVEGKLNGVPVLLEVDSFGEWFDDREICRYVYGRVSFAPVIEKSIEHHDSISDEKLDRLRDTLDGLLEPHEIQRIEDEIVERLS